MTNRESKKLAGRLVQPALPLVPGKKSQKAKPVATETASDVVELEAPPQSLPNGGIHHEQTQPVEVESNPITLQNGDHESHEASLIAEDSPPATSSTSAAEKVATPEPHDIDEDRTDGEAVAEVDAGYGSQDVNSEDASGLASSDAAISAIQLPAEVASAERENDITGEEHTPELASSPFGDGDSEQQMPTQSTHQQSEQTDPTTPVYANGIGSPHFTPTEHGAFESQHEQVTQGYDYTPNVATGEESHAPTVNGYQPPLTTSLGLSSAAVPRPFNALPSLAEHLLLLNATKEGVDIIIQVNASKTQPFASYAHSIVLLRSLRLRRLVTRQQQSSNNYAGNVVTLYPARYVMPHAFEAALRYLYSDTVLGKDFFVQPHSGSDYQTVRVHNLDYLLSYWVSGIELGLEPVSICAERLLNNYLDWDILEITYKYAMELADSPNMANGKNMTGSDYLVASSTIVKQILQFLALHIDISTFKLDTTTAHNLIPSRLPQIDDGRPKHNPALAAMVFGSMPSSADMSPSSPQSEILSTQSTFKDTVASNILLNVDFENLFAFNNFIQAPTIRDAATTKLMTDLVNEREIRRQKVHSSRVSNKDRMAYSAAWEAVGIKESILETNVLHRDRVGFLASTSSK
ncbi:hypothetical protein H2200_005815 [Cladophialophora chaetospira]|uniref:BTB domain-containing protein n=1 Tax=Cladophialophora chaetospira TaxID=386627 RepID=A0AA38X9V6_9EURO|nr:hypothetical protein H2200_005815 [Cladophialophora chaetospira]